MPGDVTKNQVANSRKRSAAKVERTMTPRVERALLSFAKESSSRVARGETPVPRDYATRWARALYDAQAPGGYASAVVGQQSAERILRAVSAAPKARKAVDPFADPGEVGIGAGGDFLLTPTRKSVASYFRNTSRAQAGTVATKVDDVFAKIRDARDKNGNALGLDAAKIARELYKEMGTWSRPYSRLIARTGTIWAMNASANQSYMEAGVERAEWWATEDDLTCPYCGEMHGKTVQIGEQFAGPGKPAPSSDPDRNPLTFRNEITVEHPPLHPHCRCTVMPVIDESEFAADEEPPEPIEPEPEPIEPESGPAEPAIDEPVPDFEDLADIHGDTDPGFTRTIANEFRSRTPVPVLRAFKADRVRVSASNRLTDGHPSLVGKHPQGWPAGTTWDHAEGVYMVDKKTIAVAKQLKNRFRTEQIWEDSHRPLAVLAHETGHAAHAAIQRRTPEFDAELSRQWRKATRAIAKGPKEDRQLLAYFMQKKGAGAAEAFAEAYAIEFHSLASGGELIQRTFEQYFGGLRYAIRRAIEELKP
jgi:hypothetical protein